MTLWRLSLLFAGLVSIVLAAVRSGGQALAGSLGWLQRVDGMTLLGLGVLAVLAAGWGHGGG